MDKYDRFLDDGAHDKYDAFLDGPDDHPVPQAEENAGGPGSQLRDLAITLAKHIFQGDPGQMDGKLDPIAGLKGMLGGTEPQPGFTKAGMVLNGLEGAARVGRTAAEGMTEAGNLVSPGAGKVAGGATKMLLPQDRVSAAAALAFIADGLATAEETGKSAVGSISKLFKGKAAPAPVGTPALPGEIPQTTVIKPTGLQKTLGSAISATTAIPERYASAVVADPLILSAETPTVAKVSQEYAQVFKRLGERFDTKLVQKYLNKNYIPGPEEAQALNKKAFEVFAQLQEDPSKVTAARAMLARSQAAALQRSDLAAKNPSFMKAAGEMKFAFDEHLVNNGVPEIRELSARYFKSIAKEHFESLLPRNKNMSPNALRSMIAMRLGVQAVQHAAQGEGIAAVGKAVQAGAMSPLIVGGAIRGAAATGAPQTAGYVAGNLAGQALNPGE